MMMEPWFNPIRFGALYGGIGGGLLGALGGILGAAAGTLAPKGKGRSFILCAFKLMMLVALATSWLASMLCQWDSLSASGIHWC